MSGDQLRRSRATAKCTAQLMDVLEPVQRTDAQSAVQWMNAIECQLALLNARPRFHVNRTI